MKKQLFYYLIFLLSIISVNAFEQELSSIQSLNPNQLMPEEVFNFKIGKAHDGFKEFCELLKNDEEIHKIIDVQKNNKLLPNPIIDYYIGYHFEDQQEIQKALGYYCNLAYIFPWSALAVAEILEQNKVQADYNSFKEVLQYLHLACNVIHTDNGWFVCKSALQQKIKYLKQVGAHFCNKHSEYWKDLLATTMLKNQIFATADEDKKNMQEEIAHIYYDAWQFHIPLTNELHPFYNLYKASQYGYTQAKIQEKNELIAFFRRMPLNIILERECIYNYLARLNATISEETNESLIATEEDECQKLWDNKQYEDCAIRLITLRILNQIKFTNCFVKNNDIERKMIEDPQPLMCFLIMNMQTDQQRKIFYLKKIKDILDQESLPDSKRQDLLSLLMNVTDYQLIADISSLIQYHKEKLNFDSIEQLKAHTPLQYAIWKVILNAQSCKHKDLQEIIEILKEQLNNTKKETVKIISEIRNSGFIEACDCNVSISIDFYYLMYIVLEANYRMNQTYENLNCLIDLMQKMKQHNLTVDDQLYENLQIQEQKSLEDEYRQMSTQTKRKMEILELLYNKYPHSCLLLEEYVRNDITNIDRLNDIAAKGNKDAIDALYYIYENLGNNNDIAIVFPLMFSLFEKYNTAHAMQWCMEHAVDYFKKNNPDNWKQLVIDWFKENDQDKYIDVMIKGAILACELGKPEEIYYYCQLDNHPILKLIKEIVEYPEKTEEVALIRHIGIYLGSFKNELNPEKKVWLELFKQLLNTNFVKQKAAHMKNLDYVNITQQIDLLMNSQP